MQATIHITGFIGDVDKAFLDTISESENYSFTMLASDIKTAREAGATSFKFLFDSNGGYVDEAFLMASYIESLTEKTQGVAIRVYSACNIPFFACDKRECEERGMFMLHQAWASFEGNSTDLRKYADHLDITDSRMANYIASRIGLDYEAVKGIMGIDRFIEKEEAEKLGFFNFLNAPKVAALYTKKEDNNMNESVQKAFEVIKKAIGMGDKDPDPVAMDLELEDGSNISVNSEDGEYVGKTTNAPDGTHRLRDGREITVEGGVIQSISEVQAMEDIDEEKEEMRKQIAELQSKVQEYEASAQAMESKAEEQATAYKALEEQITFIAKNVSTDKKPPVKNHRFNQAGQNGKSEGKQEAKPQTALHSVINSNKSVKEVAEELRAKAIAAAKESKITA